MAIDGGIGRIESINIFHIDNASGSDELGQQKQPHIRPVFRQAAIQWWRFPEMIGWLPDTDWNHPSVQPHGKILEMILDECDAAVRRQEEDKHVTILLFNGTHDAGEPPDRQA